MTCRTDLAKQLARRVSAANRDRKWRLFLAEIEPNPQMTVLDVGFCEREVSPTDNYIERHYPYPYRLTALGIDTPKEFRQRYPQVKAVHYDGCCFPFADKEFDVCWSNAVIEHVGGPERQIAFLTEVKRVSRRAIITTPNRLFPVEVHTRTPLLHYLPDSLFDRYLELRGKGDAAGELHNLLSKSDFRNRLSRADIDDYQLFTNRFLGIALDFVAVINCGES